MAMNKRIGALACTLAATLASGCDGGGSALEGDAGVVLPEAGVAFTCGPASPDFYAFEQPLPSRDGELIKCEQLDEDPEKPRLQGYRGYRVMYRSSVVIHESDSEREQAIPVTGVVYVPTDSPPAEGRPLIANPHGTVGAVLACAPSFGGGFDGWAIKALKQVVPGAVIALPDYPGLGVDNGLRPSDAELSLTDTATGKVVRPFANMTHSFLSLESEGRSTIDLVRAARQLPDAALGNEPTWVVVGQSQGGHAALATGELYSRGYGSELRLLGVVAGAPSSQLTSTDYFESDVMNLMLPVMLAGVSIEWRDLHAKDLLTNEALSAVAQTSGTGCLTADNIVPWISTFQTYLANTKLTRAPDLSDNPGGFAALHANEPGYRATHVPIFIGQVEGDPVIDPRRTARLLEQERHTNPTGVTSCIYPGQNLELSWLARANNHDSFTAMFSDQTRASAKCKDGSGAEVTTDAVSFVKGLFDAR